jgi:carboxymethylenebutenolidase
MPHVQAATAEGIQADVAAAVEWLRTRSGVDSAYTVGFCIGGRHSWLSAAGGHGLAGAVGFYGRPGQGQDGTPGPAQRAGEMACPILALQAGDDQNITAEDNAAFEQALAAAGVEHELVTYEGAPHSFFDRRQEDFAAASDDAWTRVLSFVDRHGSA